MDLTREIGTHLGTQYQTSAKGNFSLGRLVGLLMIAIGVGGWWYNCHLATTAGEFYIKLCLLGPLGVGGGILMLIRPEWAGPLRSDSTRAHKMALIAVIAFMFIASGIDFYRLKYSQVKDNQPSGLSPASWTPSLAARPNSMSTEVTFLDRTYRLASFNQKQHATWEFVTGEEKIDDWKTLVTIIDRPDARTREDLDRLAEGIMATYKNHGGQILTAKTMQDSGAIFNYMVAAFEEPAKQRFELNFVKIILGPRHAAVMVYGVRITDPRDYTNKAKEFLNRSSGDVGRALSNASLPDLAKLPRTVF